MINTSPNQEHKWGNFTCRSGNIYAPVRAHTRAVICYRRCHASKRLAHTKGKMQYSWLHILYYRSSVYQYYRSTTGKNHHSKWESWRSYEENNHQARICGSLYKKCMNHRRLDISEIKKWKLVLYGISRREYDCFPFWWTSILIYRASPRACKESESWVIQYRSSSKRPHEGYTDPNLFCKA